MTRTVRQPALIRPSTGDRALDRWLEAASQRLEFLEGNALTQRDLTAVSQQSSVARQVLAGSKGVVVNTGSGETVLSFDAFAENIRGTGLYRDLSRRIDDPSRFDQLHERTKAVLLAELAPIDGKITSEIRRVEESFSSASESFAQEIATVRTSVAQAAAGVRQVRFASANENRATAGQVTQITARLNNFTGGAPGTATVESKMTAIADRATGLEAKYVLKVTAGGAMAGFGVAATDNGSGNATSAFIIQADKFAIVDSSYVGGLTNTPPAANILFGVDADGSYFKGDMKVGGRALIQGAWTYGAYDQSALYVNMGNAAQNGIMVSSGTAGKAAVKVVASSGAYGLLGSVSGGGAVVFGQASGGSGTAIVGQALATGNIGVQATGAFGGTALAVNGPMTIDNSTQVSGLNANYLQGNAASAFAAASHTHGYVIDATGTGQSSIVGFNSGVATGTAVLTGKPGANSNSEWVEVKIGTQTRYMLVWV